MVSSHEIHGRVKDAISRALPHAGDNCVHSNQHDDAFHELECIIERLIARANCQVMEGKPPVPGPVIILDSDSDEAQVPAPGVATTTTAIHSSKPAPIRDLSQPLYPFVDLPQSLRDVPFNRKATFPIRKPVVTPEELTIVDETLALPDEVSVIDGCRGQFSGSNSDSEDDLDIPLPPSVQKKRSSVLSTQFRRENSIPTQQLDLTKDKDIPKWWEKDDDIPLRVGKPKGRRQPFFMTESVEDSASDVEVETGPAPRKKRPPVIQLSESEDDGDDGDDPPESHKESDSEYAPDSTDVEDGIDRVEDTVFAKRRSELALSAYKKFNEAAFGRRLPDDLPLVWTKRLNSTAGRTWTKRSKNPGSNAASQDAASKGGKDSDVYSNGIAGDDGWYYMARIELGVKVLDCHDKLLQTLLHEMCHVAAWIVDHVVKPPHGAVFKSWAKQASAAYPHLAVTTRHSYDIAFKFTYRCTNAACAQVYGRHSKSIDLKKHRCKCGQALALERNARGKRHAEKGQVPTPRPPNRYQTFVKDQYSRVKTDRGLQSHADVMAALSELWSGMKLQGDGDEQVSNHTIRYHIIPYKVTE